MQGSINREVFVENGNKTFEVDPTKVVSIDVD